MSHRGARRIWAIEVATIVGIAVAFCRPASAQVIERDDARMDVGPMYSDAVSLSNGRLPPNLVTPEVLRPLLTKMWRSSATFRRQCAQLAEHPEVRIRIALDPRTTHGRALSRVHRSEADLDASIQIEMRDPTRYVEYLAHELEHVLEQIDGTDRARLARQHVDGVVNVGGVYETARARSVGRTVAHEVMVQ
jgi:hypothetical protein